MLRANPRRRFLDQVFRKEPDVSYEQAADNRILSRADRNAAVGRDTGSYLFHAGGPVGLAEELPCLGDSQPRRVAEKPSADNLVVRVVGLEEERFAWVQCMKASPAAWAPEVDFSQTWPGV